MDFDGLKTRIKNTGFDTMRIDNDDYLEVVVKKETIVKITQVFENLLGKPAWPSKAKLTKEAKEVVDNLGGLRKGQILFFLNTGGVSLFAMLWPWRDGERVTLKIGRKEAA